MILTSLYDREPYGDIEVCLVNGMRDSAPAVVEVWVRRVPVNLEGGVWTPEQPPVFHDPTRSILRVYLALAHDSFNQDGRERADRVMEETQMRFFHDSVTFEVRHIRVGVVPEGGSAPRIFRRETADRLWLPPGIRETL